MRPAACTGAARRRALVRGGRIVALLCAGVPIAARAQQPSAGAGTAEAGWHAAAEAMRQRALSWGDQPYGAVLVLDGTVVGEGPSRVVQRGDPSAHAEREAIRDAQRRLGRRALDGSVLVSTSRPCAACEAAAAEAGVQRMLFGAALSDAGQPRRAAAEPAR